MQYELWDLEHEAPTVLEEYKLPLDEANVALQIQRFLKYTRPSMHDVKHELALHFPSSIGNNLDAFTVLRTAFLRDYRLDRVKQRSSNSAVWRSVLIPVVHNIDETLLLGSSVFESSTSYQCEMQGILSCNTILKLSQTPLYRVSSFNDYMLYECVGRYAILPRGEEVANSIAIFLISRFGRKDSITMISCIEGDRDQGYINRCTFHSSLPLMTFYFGSLIGESKIVLWRFAPQSRHDSKGLIHLNFSSLLQTSVSSDSIFSVVISRRLETLHFSASGKELVYKVFDNPHSVVIRIGATLVYSTAQVECSDTVSKTAPSGLELSSQNTHSGLTTQSSISKLLSLGTALAHCTDVSTQLKFKVDTANRDIELVHRSGNREERQLVLSLPAWKDLHHIKPSIRMPTSTRQDKIMIILNRSAKPLCTLSDDVEETTPAMVIKDLRALPPSHKRKGDLGLANAVRNAATPSQLLEQPSWVGRQRDESMGEERTTKKLRAKVT